MNERNPGRDKDLQGEGNREADLRYREGVRKTVWETTDEERLELADDISDRELKEAEDAEEQGRSRARE